jgi:hypothetical protein
MEHSGHVCRSVAAVLILALVSAGTVRPAGAQTNTFLGSGALGKVTTGTDNTALGFDTLFENTTNSNNTAVGANALGANIADGNTAVGANALFANNSAVRNTAVGFNALFSHQAGVDNTATGDSALMSDITGFNNTAIGSQALRSNTTGTSNTATGSQALPTNTNGFNNTATGTLSLRDNTSGTENTADGAAALADNTTGGNNTAIGGVALSRNTTGSGNIAIGVGAGANLTTGNNNIEIGNVGVAAESNTIRIGTKGVQTRTLIAGINNAPVLVGSPVLVNAIGRLGIQVSSARFKRDIREMGKASGGLMKLRPVTFRYKDDPAGTLQYGLVAEEVARVYPELVTYGADGQVEAVAYHLLPAMLLNEMQKQVRENQRKDEWIAVLQEQLVTHQGQINALQKEAARIDTLAARLSALEEQARTDRAERLAAATH